MSDFFIKSNEQARSLNNSSPADQNNRSGDAIKTAQRLTSIKGTYDFSEKGGAVSIIKLLDDDGKVVQIPAGAIVKAIFTNETTVLTSGGSATVKLEAGAIDLSSAIAFDTGFSGINAHGIQGGAASGVLISSDTDLQIEIEVAALTAGVLEYYVDVLII